MSNLQYLMVEIMFKNIGEICGSGPDKNTRIRTPGLLILQPEI